MKTIVSNTNCSKYLFADDTQVNVKADCIEIGDPANLDFIIGDLNSSNSTLIEGVTTPDDWYGCKYSCAADGTWSLVEGWVDPRIEEDAA
jgi:hypothetical protein